jgi:hypothetical protein
MLVSRSMAQARDKSSDSPSRSHRDAAQSPGHPLLRLQRTAGNAAVARLLDRSTIAREAMPEEEEELQAKHDVQREGMPEEEELQMKRDGAFAEGAVGLEGGKLPEEAANEIESLRGGGSALSDSIRGSVEPALGLSLEKVRVHQDSKSDALARSMTAKAFTTGTDVFLREDQSPSDEHLMAHELAHVAQQSEAGGAGVGRQMSVGAANDPSELEADRIADAVVRGSQAESLDEA